MNHSKPIFKTFGRFILLLLSMFVFPGSALAVNYYLDPANGNDSNNGSVTSPWKTMNKVIVSLSPGDTVFIKGGTYTEDQYYDPNSDAFTKGYLVWRATSSLGTANNPITIKAAPGEKVVFDGGGNQYFLYIWADNQAYPGHYVVVKDLEFRNYEGIALRTDFGVKNMAIDNCSFINFTDGDTGAVAIAHSENIIIKNSFFENIGVVNYKQHPIYIAEGNKNVLLDNNFIKGTSGNGSQNYGHYDYTMTTRNLIIRRNRVINAQNNNLIIASTNYDGIYIYNNTFYSEKGSYTLSGSADTNVHIAIRFLNSATLSNVKIKNNIGYGHVSLGGVWVEDTTDISIGFLLNYNMWSNLNDQNRIYYWNSVYYDLPGFRTATGYGLNSVVDNPLFSDLGAFDFSLTPDSPARDKGTFLTKTVGSGNGTNITIEDAGYFIDGFDMIKGDIIQVGSNNPVSITAIDYDNNIITVDTNISWKDGEGVSLPYSGTKPDMGAYEHAGDSDTIPPLPPTGLQATD